MGIYQELHQARCEQIKGNTTASMSHYSTAMNLIDKAKTNATPEEVKEYESIMQMVVEEFGLVSKSLERNPPALPPKPAGLVPSTIPSENSTFIPSPEPFSVSPNNEDERSVHSVEEESTHPPFAEQLQNDINFVKNHLIAGYEYCSDAIQKIDSDPRVKAFQQGTKEAGITLVSGIATSCKLVFKAFSDLFTEQPAQPVYQAQPIQPIQPTQPTQYTTQPGMQEQLPVQQPVIPQRSHVEVQNAYIAPTLSSDEERDEILM